MNKADYSDAVAWIATHGPRTETPSTETIQTYLITMTSDLFGVDEPIVAADVAREYRKQQRRVLRTVADVRRERAQ